MEKAARDSNIVTFQNWLNTIFGNSAGWVHITPNGNTGTTLMQATVRAFQIEHSITPTGELGPVTLACMKNMKPIVKMDPNDEPSVDVCLIQGALFAKGYNAGGITGIYYTTGVNAVRTMQQDAGIDVDGIINWKVWAGLLSLFWFKLVDNGDSRIQKIQRQLNIDWADQLGIGPCDGVISRRTALSLIGALQAAEGLTVVDDLTQINFGPSTFSKCPTLSINSSSSYAKYIKILQYALYVNGYETNNFNGTYDESTRQQVSKMQTDYALVSVGAVSLGIANPTTIKALMTSTGDQDRKAYACDCSTVLNRQQALDIKKAGYTHVGRYLTGSVGNDFIPKYLTKEEIKYISEAGLSVFLIYQDGGYYSEYFQNRMQGSEDARIAIEAARKIGAPTGSIIYFAVDFDCYGDEVIENIIPYFWSIKQVFFSGDNPKGYRIGIYAPRQVCTIISNKKYADASFICGMSWGFAGNLGFPLPKNWVFDQFFEFELNSSPSFPLDKVSYSGKIDGGISAFDVVSDDTASEIDKKRVEQQKNSLRNDFVYRVADAMNFSSQLIDFTFSYNAAPIHLATVTDGTFVMNIDMRVYSDWETNTDSSIIPIDLDSNGNLSTGFKDNVNKITTVIKDADLKSKVEDYVANIAISATAGYIELSYEFAITGIKFTIKVFSDELKLKGTNVTAKAGISFEFTLNKLPSKPGDESSFDINKAFEYAFAVVLVGVAIYTGVGAAVAGLEAFSAWLTSVGIFVKQLVPNK